MARLETTERLTINNKQEANEATMSEVLAERLKGSGAALERSKCPKSEPAFLDLASPYNNEKAHEKKDKPGEQSNGLRTGKEINAAEAEKEGVCHLNKVQKEERQNETHQKHETKETKGLKTGLETTREAYLRHGAGKDNEVASTAGKKTTAH